MDHGYDQKSSDAAEVSEHLEPAAASRILAESRQQAHRQFNMHPPLLTVIRAVIIFAGYGVVWWSVRGQSPYVGPSGGAILAIYGAVLLVVFLTAGVAQGATKGITGASRESRKINGVAYGAVWVAVAVYQGALHFDGFGHSIVYGVFPASGQLLVIGAVLAGSAAARKTWPELWLAISIVALGTGAAFAGPIGVWGVDALGGAAIGIGCAIFQVRRQRLAMVA
ncbi:MAG: hypothetical protein ACRDV0_09580 [Acidimicrobiales bacterium]